MNAQHVFQEVGKLTQKTTELLEAVLGMKSSMEAHVEQSASSAEESAQSEQQASEHLMAVGELKTQLEALSTQAEQLVNDAVAIAYGDGASATPAPGSIPVAGADGTIDPGWLPGDWSELAGVLASVISNTRDILKLYEIDLEQDKNITGLNSALEKLGQQVNKLEELRRENEHNLSRVGQDLSNLAMVTADQDEYMSQIMRGMGQTGFFMARRYYHHGDKAYHRPFAGDYSALGIHSHWDIYGICGMAEGSAIINGKYVSRRHTDYHARMPAPADSVYMETVPVERPETPVDVAALPADQQYLQMRKYWEVAAGKRPASDVADFESAFTLCLTYEEMVEEEFDLDFGDTFFSGRHQIDASAIQELLDKNQYFSESGHKNRLENLSYWHSMVKRINDDGTIRLAVRKTRVVTMPVGSLADYPMTDLVEPVDDLLTKQRYGWTAEQMEKTRHQRFRVKHRKGQDNTGYRSSAPELMDELMAKIPGLDGVGATIDEAYDQYGLRDEISEFGDSATKLNAAYYNRFYRISYNDASNRRDAMRGYNDPTLWVARTTREEVSPTKAGNEEIRVSYAIPLELIVIGPDWNPYDVPENPAGYQWQTYNNDQSIGDSQNNPLPGYFTTARTYYHTPIELFSDNAAVADVDPADTATAYKWVTCADGVARRHTPSGIPVFMPNIPGVGSFRIRYPIPYLFHEGSYAHAMTQAVQDEAVGILALEASNTNDILRQGASMLKMQSDISRRDAEQSSELVRKTDDLEKLIAEIKRHISSNDADTHSLLALGTSNANDILRGYQNG